MMKYLNEYDLHNLRLKADAYHGDDKIYWLLLQCIKATANNDIYIDTQGYPGDPIEGQLHPYWSIQRYGLEAASLIGKASQGNSLSSGFLYLVNTLSDTYKNRILNGCNFRQRVYIESPTLSEICQSISNKNTLVSGGFAFIPFKAVEADDDYGQVIYRWLWKKVSHVKVETISESPHDLIMSIYFQLHGRKPLDMELLGAQEDLKWYKEFSLYTTMMP